MTRVFPDLKNSVTASTVLVSAFMLTEWLNGHGFAGQSSASLPLGLFGMMWLLATGFGVMFMQTARSVRAEGLPTANPALFLLRLVFMALFLVILAAIIQD